MRVGVIGFGKMGMLHAGLFNSIDGFKLHAIADTSKFVLRVMKSVCLIYNITMMDISLLKMLT